MAFLEQFDEKEREIVVSLPYRVGLWVGSVDDAGGAKADFEELSALENIIAEKSRGMFESAFVHEVMSETFSKQESWKSWAENLDAVPEDCTKAIKIVADKLDEKDIDAYRSNVMGIGLSVAKAFREFDADQPFFVKLITNIRLFIEAIARLIMRDNSYDKKSALNISYEEDMALTKLSKALHPGVDAS